MRRGEGEGVHVNIVVQNLNIIYFQGFLNTTQTQRYYNC